MHDSNPLKSRQCIYQEHQRFSYKDNVYLHELIELLRCYFQQIEKDKNNEDFDFRFIRNNSHVALYYRELVININISMCDIVGEPILSIILLDISSNCKL